MSANTVVVHHPIPPEVERVLQSAGYRVLHRADEFTTYERRVSDEPVGGTPSGGHGTDSRRLLSNPESTPHGSWPTSPLAVSPRQAAAFLNIGHDLVYQLVYSGRIRSVKLGRRRLIPMSELVRFLDQEAN